MACPVPGPAGHAITPRESLGPRWRSGVPRSRGNPPHVTTGAAPHRRRCRSGSASPWLCDALALRCVPPAFLCRDGGPELVIRGENPVVAMPVLPRWRHEISKPVQKVKRRELDDAVGPRPRGLDDRDANRQVLHSNPSRHRHREPEPRLAWLTRQMLHDRQSRASRRRSLAAVERAPDILSRLKTQPRVRTFPVTGVTRGRGSLDWFGYECTLRSGVKRKACHLCVHR
jgi:hypothetical protein